MFCAVPIIWSFSKLFSESGPESTQKFKGGKFPTFLGIFNTRKNSFYYWKIIQHISVSDTYVQKKNLCELFEKTVQNTHINVLGNSWLDWGI